MIALPAERRDFLLWLIGTGVGLIAIAFTLHPVEIPVIPFVALVILASACVAWGGVSLGRKRSRRKPSPHLVASECQRVSELLSALIADQWRKQPRSKRFLGNGFERWAEETIRRYNDELRILAKRVYRDAIACGVVSPNSALLVDSPQPTQLPSLRDLFREAADTLERM